MKNLIKILFFILIFNISNANKLYPQPSNYWTVSFNSEASLLAGAVVGGNSGITSIYYNPAGIIEVENKMLALNANLFNLSKTYYKNALGTGNNLDYLGFTVKPRFISYQYKTPKSDNMVLQFALFNRNSGRVNMYDQVKQNVQLIRPEIKEKYTGYFDFSKNYMDTWGGFGLAYKVSENFFVGISSIVSYKDFKYLKSIGIYINPTENDLPDSIPYYNANSGDYERINMYDVRFIGKLGFRLKMEQISYGLNFTFPSLKLFGKADVTRSISNTEIRYENQAVDDVFLNQSSTHLKSGFKEPFSVSLGIKYTGFDKLESSYFTIEYFHKIKTYKAIDGTETTQNKYEPASDFLSFKYGAKSILNLALGFQYVQSEKIEWLYGFKINFNPYEVSLENEYQYLNEFVASPSDYYHLSVGSKFNYKKLSLIVGFEYTLGISKNISEFVNFAEPEINLNQPLFLAGQLNHNMTLRTNMLGLYLGLTLGN